MENDHHAAHAARRTMMRRGCRIALAASVALFLAACAAPVPVVDARLAPLTGAPSQRIQLQSSAVVRLSTGRNRPLAAGSQWQAVGTLAEGTVYRPVEGVFQIVGRNVHEAYLVIRDGVLHGFYLPGESRFSPLVPPLPLTIGAI